MAGRGHVDVSERRLRPIYDALDASNNKKAIQEADKVLRKQKDLICAKALKAIALLRSSRRQEALLLAAEVASQEPIEEATLQALTICYREMERGDLVARIYENAVKKVPQSEESLSHLFMAYVRLGEYKKQQQTGMALYKVVPKNPYYFWSVMSIVMQALTTEDEKLSQKMFLPLAERMVEKMAKDMKIEAEAEVRLYLMILEKQKKYEEALEVVVGPLGSKLISEIELQSLKQAELYVQLEDWPKANAKYRKLLLTNPDNWLWYIHYFNSLFHLVNSGWTPSEADEGSSTDVITGTVDMAIAFVEERVEDELKNGKRLQRGPFLARMELLKRLTERGNQEAADKIGSPSDLLKEYFGKFGDKPSCFMDMRPYLTMMKLDDHAKFVEELQTYLEIPKKGGELSLPSDVKSMQRHICCVGLARSLGLQEHLTERNRDELIQDLMRRHQHGLQFGKDLLPTDVQPSDSYLLMTVHIKYAVYLKTQERSLLFEMIVMLEKGVACSPSNAQYKLILIKLYILLGAFQPCKKLYDNMEIKHIQQDTLGHFYSCYAVALGHLTSACSILSAMLKFFSANHKDTTEYIIAAYKYGSFHKIPEIISFRERLNLSHNYSALAVERMLLDFIMETTNPEQMRELLDFMEISPEKDEIKWDLLKDNRDMTVLSSWEPKERELTDQQIEQSFCQDKQWLRLRSLILRSLAAVILMSQPAPLDGEHSLDKQDASKNGESQVGDGNTLLSLILEINAHVQDVECQPSSGNMYLLCGPVPTRMKVYLDGQHHILLTSIFQVAVDVHSLETSDLTGQSQELQEQISRNFDCILKTLEYVLDSMDTPIATPGSPPQVYPQVLQGLVLLVETLCLMALVTSQCQVMLKPLKATLTKKKKKKKNPTTIVPQVFNDYKMFVDSLVQFGEKLHKCLMEVNTVITGVDVSTLEIGPVLEHAEKDAISVETVWKKVKDSYQISVGEMSEVLKQKLQFLRTIRL